MKKLLTILLSTVLLSTISWFIYAQNPIDSILDRLETQISSQNACDRLMFWSQLEKKFGNIQLEGNKQQILQLLLDGVHQRKKSIGVTTQGVDAVAFLCAVNDLRSLYGVWPLNYNQDLNEVANLYVNYLYTTKDFSHTTQNGVWLKERIDSTTYTYEIAWENLARWYTNIQDVIDAWMASPGHKKNLLDPRYTDMWLAYLHGYRVHLFAAPTTQ